MNTLSTPITNNQSLEEEEYYYLLWIKNKDQGALEILLTGLKSFAYNSAYLICRNHALTEEIVQESFLRIINSTQFYGGSFRAWFHKIIINQSRYLFRTEKNITNRPFHQSYLNLQKSRIADYSDSTITPPESGEKSKILMNALQSMNNKFRAPLLLFFYKKMNKKQIGELLKISPGLVAYRIKIGLGILRQRLNDSGYF